MRAPSSSRSQAWASDRTPSADGADVTGGGDTWPLPAGTWRPFCASFEVAGRHLFLQWGFRKQGTGTHFSPLLFSFPSPTKNGAGGSGRVKESPLRVFPPTLTLWALYSTRRVRALRRNSFRLPHTSFSRNGKWELGPLCLSSSDQAATPYLFGVSTPTAPGS